MTLLALLESIVFTKPEPNYEYEKRCFTCEEIKALSEFYNIPASNGRKARVGSNCKTCCTVLKNEINRKKRAAKLQRKRRKQESKHGKKER